MKLFAWYYTNSLQVYRAIIISAESVCEARAKYTKMQILNKEKVVFETDPKELDFNKTIILPRWTLWY